MAQSGDINGGRRPVAFISHHSSQEKTARHLKDVLERNGVTGWMAPDDIDPGVAFDQAIIEQVERSDLIVLLFCSQSDQSRHVKRELMMAENNKKLIYPVRLEDIDAKGLAYWLNDYQWIDWIDRRDATIQRMIETIKRQVDTGDDATPAEPVAPVVEDGPQEPPAAMAADAPVAPPVGTEQMPAGLMGGGAATGVARSGSGGLGSIPKKGWIAIGAGAAVVLLLLVLMLGSMGGESEFKVRPGQWETTYEVDRILVNSGVPQADLDAFIQQFEAEVSTQCISEADARSPGNDFFDPERTNNCAMSNLTMENGEFGVQLACRPPDLNNMELMVWMRGEYEQESMTAETEYAFGPGTNQELRFVANQTGRYIGECE